MFAPIKRVENAHTDSIWSIAWTEGGKVITGSIDESVCVWEVPAASAEEEKKIEGDMKISLKETFGDHALGVISVAAQPTGKYVAASSMDSHIRIWDLSTGSIHKLIDAGPVETWTVDFHPTSMQVASGSQSGHINLWDANTGKKLQSLETKGKFAMSVAYSPDGSRIACGGYDGVITIFDVSTATLVTKIEAHSMPVRSVTFSPDGKNLYSASDDGRVNVYDTSSMSAHSTSLSCTLTGHTSWVLDVAASSDLRHVATSSTDKTVRVWDIGRRECVYKAEQHNDQVWGVAFSPSGSLLASVGDDKSIQFYQVKA